MYRYHQSTWALSPNNSQASHVNWSMNHIATKRYQIYSAKQIPTQRITANAQLTRKLLINDKNQQPIYANLLNRQVQPQQIAMAKNKAWYVKISYRGKTLGWINKRYLHPVTSYLLPYTYVSQFWPSAADDACEIASLKTALSVENKANNVPLRRMVMSIPRTSDPNKGYTKNPYVYGSHATINPSAMVKVAKQYHAHAKDITGANKQELIYNTMHGYPTVIEGPYMMKKPGSDHDLVIVGYKKGSFKLVDPFSRTPIAPHTLWISTNEFMTIFNKKFRQQHALVIY